MQIKSKKNIIDHFNEGIKKKLLIGVENEKFLFQEKSNKRPSYNKVRQGPGEEGYHPSLQRISFEEVVDVVDELLNKNQIPT